MTRRTLIYLLGITTLVASTAAPAAGKPKTEREKIESLIAAVESLKDATFIRNGKEYDCKTAADHMRAKWKWQGGDIKTARDFIRLVATKSSESGKPYLIRFKGGKEVESGKFLAERLDKIEKPAKD